MGLFDRNSFLGSCFRGWGSSNMAVQAVGCMIGVCIAAFVILWYIVKFIIKMFDKHKEKQEAQNTAKLNITMEDGIPNFNSGNYTLHLEAINDRITFVSQLNRVTGYHADLTQSTADACPTNLIKGMSLEDAESMKVYLQKDDCCVVSIVDATAQ